jgi:tRNA modification GTPase
MYGLEDNVIAVSSPTSDGRVIIRLSGPQAFDKVNLFFIPKLERQGASIFYGTVAVVDGLDVEAKVYCFCAPHSYTGQDLVEIHFDGSRCITEALLAELLGSGARPAQAGEFTARAFLNGRLDLTQAEAVNEVIVASNRLQLAAAQKLLDGRLSRQLEQIRSSVLDCLSLLEAGLDFSGEGIEFITTDEAVERLNGQRGRLLELLDGSIVNESIIDLPSVGIAGAPNAGKSSLLNSLLGVERSIVSPHRKTTRDVLTGLLSLADCSCILFDCAGLVLFSDNILDRLARSAAVSALQKASLVLFCVDMSKSDWSEDLQVRQMVEADRLVMVAAKSDLVKETRLSRRLVELEKTFGSDFIATSTKTGSGIELLKKHITSEILELGVGGRGDRTFTEGPAGAVALTARHKQAVKDAIEQIDEAIQQLQLGSSEVSTMMLRAAYQGLLDVEQQGVDERILQQIFSRFCIGK